MEWLSKFIPREECYVCRENVHGINCVGPFDTFLEADEYHHKHNIKNLYRAKLLSTYNFYPNLLKSLYFNIQFNRIPKIQSPSK